VHVTYAASIIIMTRINVKGTQGNKIMLSASLLLVCPKFDNKKSQKHQNRQELRLSVP